MIIGVPREIKQDEYRVGMLPVGVEELTRAGHKVLIEAGAGLGSGLPDHDYLRHGAEVVAGPQEIYGRSEMIIKVKEPQPSEMPLLRRGQIIFTYFHLAADRSLDRSIARHRLHCRGLRNTPRRTRPTAAVDSHERSRRPDEHSGRGQIPGTSANGPRNSAGRRAGRRAGSYYNPRRRRGRGKCRPSRRRIPRQHRVCWTSTWTACATSTTSCRQTSR